MTTPIQSCLSNMVGYPVGMPHGYPILRGYFEYVRYHYQGRSLVHSIFVVEKVTYVP